MKDYYDQIAAGYEELHGDEQRKKIAIVLTRLKVKDRMKVLDVGCGTGIFFDFVCLPDSQKIGIDPSKELIGIAEEKKNGTYLVGNAEKLPFSDGEFDIVVSLTAIQNFTDIEKGLREIKRVCREDKRDKCRFVLTFLKKSEKRQKIERLIEESFMVEEKIEEEKDIIYFCR